MILTTTGLLLSFLLLSSMDRLEITAILMTGLQLTRMVLKIQNTILKILEQLIMGYTGYGRRLKPSVILELFSIVRDNFHDQHII